jgi:TRAP transporter TAXI family solute receptor
VLRRWLIAVTLAGALVAVMALAVLSGCGSDAEQPLAPRSLLIAGGSEAGTYARPGAGLAEAIDRDLPRLTASVEQTDGSMENLALLRKGRVQLAFTLADAAGPARGGTQRSSAPGALVGLAQLYDDYLQVVVRDNSPVGTLADLAGRRVSVGPRGSGTALVADHVLAVSDLDGSRRPLRQHLDIRAAARALAAGRIDAFFWSGRLPTGAIAALQSSIGIRLLDLGETASRLRRRYGPDVYVQSRIARAVYRLREPVTTVSVPSLLVARRDLDDETAYRLTRLVAGHPDELADSRAKALPLNSRSASTVYPLELHPGAARWYRDRVP